MNNLRKTSPYSLNFDILKITALITMLLDHIGHVLFPHIIDLRIIGRVTFPLFAFLLCYHLAKKNIFKKYIKRLLPFALFSTLLLAPFDYQEKEYFQLNIFWSFLIAIFTLLIIEKISQEKVSPFLKFFISLLALILFGSLSYLCDYDLTGFILILSFYAYFKTNKKVFIFTSLIDAILLNAEHLFTYPRIVIPFILVSFLTTLYLLYQSQYIQENQKRFLKPWWLFYLFYPVHLLILYLIKIYYF